jgi:hypothetical protein
MSRENYMTRVEVSGQLKPQHGLFSGWNNRVENTKGAQDQSNLDFMLDHQIFAVS